MLNLKNIIENKKNDQCTKWLEQLLTGVITHLQERE